jgi:lysophospholipase L1-like esterase
VVSPGDPARIEQVMARAERGQPVTIAVIGGSITAGAMATQPERRYGDLVARWWRERFPRAEVRHVNAGIGATGSNYAALRARRDLLSKRPDLVVVEFAVNDPNQRSAAETLEGLVRQILGQPQKPAVVLLFTMNRAGGNAQEWHGKIGRHYRLPMVSFRDALWPDIQAGRLAWEAVEADQVHPNDRGHAYCARLVTALLDDVRGRRSAAQPASDVRPLPPPLVSDLFEHAELYEADALRPAVNQGWTYDLAAKAWKSDTPGSVIEFEVPGRVIVSMHFVVKGPMGKARATVDGQQARELDAWFDQTWGGYRQANEIARLKEAGPHRVRFELLEANSPGSTGHQFSILGLGAAGLADPGR